MIALTIVLALPDNSPFGWFASVWDVIATRGFLMLFFSVLITITSGSVYFKAAAPALMGEKEIKTASLVQTQHRTDTGD